MEVPEALSRELKKWKKDLLDENVHDKLISKHPGFLLAVLDSINDTDPIEKVTIGLSKLVWKFPVAARFAEGYFANHDSPIMTLGSDFQLLRISEPSPKRRKCVQGKGNTVSKMDEGGLVKLLRAILIILRKLPAHVFSNWSIDQFLTLRSHSCKELQWLAVQCLAKLLKFSDSEVSTIMSGEEFTSVSVEFEEQISSSFVTEVPLVNLVSEYFPNNVINQVTPQMDLLSVGGIVAKSRSKLDPSQKQPFESLGIIPLPSVLSNLKSVLLQVQRGTPVCILGSIGVGKSSLLRFAASICGRNEYPDIITVQMSDQIDARMLLGAYHSTDLPGQFIWKPGCLTKAIINGHWIIFEDLDSAPMDVITLLDAISSTNQVMVPGYGQISKFHTEFRMFATIRTIGNIRKESEKLCKSWVNVNLNGFSEEELCLVLENLFSFPKSIVERIVKLYTSVRSAFMSNKRSVSVRDLIKLCRRLPDELDFSSPSTAITIFHEACDVFVAPLPTLDEKMSVALLIGTHLNMLSSKTEYFLTMNKPQFNICGNTNTVVAGRYDLQISSRLPAYRREDIGVYSLTKRTCCLLEVIAGAVKNSEPVLLIGETGVGKTSAIQYLAKVLHQKMVVVNLNRQSDSSDLLGGYKPVELKYIFSPLREEFEALFASSFDRQANSKFLNHIMTCFGNRRWKDLLQLMTHVQKQAVSKRSNDASVIERWEALGNQLSRIDSQITGSSESPFAFSFIEGTLIEAIKQGHWILLDEINLATSEMLQCLSGVLEKASQIHLWEKGDDQPVKRHPNFHLFAAMNPSTDIGKKDLPVGIRNRFTEVFVDELTDEDELRVLVSDYLSEMSLTNEQISNIVEFYVKVKNMSKATLIDGLGKRPHFSLRTLCRALKISSFNLYGSVKRSLYESFCLSFLTQLDYSSHPLVQNMIAKYICGKTELKALLKQPLPQPQSHDAILVGDYWLPKGNREPNASSTYILTSSVRRNLKDIARVVSAGKLPILIQGETSVGKTSLIQYLADATGNMCYRINNHQHTDLQEYIGSYQSDAQGRLVFTEGVLVKAMRRGEWIILDELNLAPSEVLEALNRLLDDNRQLFITETGVTVTAHPRFMLFATQNPPGLYGGRKLLSRAFRNRFVELHFDEIPTKELETILHARCQIPESYCKKIIAVLKELQTRRKSSAALQGKHSFATLRDLFRWAERYRLSGQQQVRFYDWDQHLADEGYLVLAGKARNATEGEVIREVLQKHMKRTVDPRNLFSLHEKTSCVTKDVLTEVMNSNISEFKHIVWTFPMRKLAVLIGCAIKFKEPVLLVGETGAGKTSIIQLLSCIYNCKLYSVNCHMHSESSDFLGGLRPVRQVDEKEKKLFEWVNGPLVEAMELGGFFLADEISLADDSVLERLNSVLEPERTLLVAEKGDETPKLIVANEKFHFIGTMNPGGDFGKKELSPALRNRLTEIWCESTTESEDLCQIIEHNLAEELKGKGIADLMIKLVRWLKNNELGNRCTVSIRDYLSWLKFVNYMTDVQRKENQLNLESALQHGACLSLLDGLGVGNMATDSTTTYLVRESALKFLRTSMNTEMIMQDTSPRHEYIQFKITESELCLGPFTLSRNAQHNRVHEDKASFTLESPTTQVNALRIFRALQLNKPILLEGSPGQGKTALVTALAKATGFPLTRINLSEQTDISDLFGTDLPVEGEEGGHFAWRDGPLLQALKTQSWILLDELNLASQSVLEGLNACLDHRGEIYVPELNKTFKIHDSDIHTCTRIFACQNPLSQGGARKGLPKSFLNRFTQVYIDSLTGEDMKFIVHNLCPVLDTSLVERMTSFATSLYESVCINKEFGLRGGPWDFNLRDLLRWVEVAQDDQERSHETWRQLHPELFVDLIYGLRMRSSSDRKRVLELFYNIWFKGDSNVSSECINGLAWGLNEVQIHARTLTCGRATITRNESNDNIDINTDGLIVLQKHLPVIESLIACLNIGWMPILVGGTGTGKTSLLRLLAKICGERLEIINPSPEMDTIELLGGFEQADIYRKIDETCVDVCDLLLRFVKKIVLLSAEFGREEPNRHQLRHGQRIADVGKRTSTDIQPASFTHSRELDWQLPELWKELKKLPHLTPDGTLSHAEEIKRIQSRVDFLQKAYLRCKSFFETEYVDGGCDLENAKKLVGKAVARDYRGVRTSSHAEWKEASEGFNEKRSMEGKEKNYATEARAAVQQHLERVARDLEQIHTHLKAGIQTGSFQWIDSILIKALVAGNWLLIDGANRCSAAVLDRLNSLMEPKGFLFLSERGSLDGKIVEIKPHPNFRLILTMDPAYGEISRAMRNRGVEIFMSNSLSTFLWESAARSSHVEEGLSTTYDDDTSATPMEVETVTGNSPPSEQNDNTNVENRRRGGVPWTIGDVYLTLESEFGISVFDLDALLRTVGISNPRLRAAVLNLHREIHQAVASSSSGGGDVGIGGGGGGGLDGRFSKLVSTWKQMALQMENGISYKEAMWNAFTSAYVAEGGNSLLAVLMDADKKAQIEEVITRYCQGLGDNTFVEKLNENGKIVPIRTITNCANAQTYRIWKTLDVVSNALSETAWSQYESWRISKCAKLVEDFLLVSAFSSVMKQDVGGLSLLLSKLYPLKSNFVKKLTTVLETTCSSYLPELEGSFMQWISLYNYGDIQGVAHLMLKFADGNRVEQGKFLDSQMKTSLKLHAENEIFHSVTSPSFQLQHVKKGTLGFVAKNTKRTDSGNLFEFLFGFWQIVTKYEKLVDACLCSSYSQGRNRDGDESSSGAIVAQYSGIWMKGMIAVLWRKWMMELIQEEFNLKRPSEKLKSNVALLVQWIGEQVVPTLDAIKGIDNSSEGRELGSLVQKCLEPLDHCGDRMLLQKSASFRSFYGIRPFLPTDSLSIVNSALSICLKLWTTSAPVDMQKIASLLASCSNGNGAEIPHRILSEICKRIFRIDSTSVSLEDANLLEELSSSLNKVLGSKDIPCADEQLASKDFVEQCTKIVDSIQNFLQILGIPLAHSKYSVFVSPILQALGDSSGSPTALQQYENLQSLFLWEEKERFRNHYTKFPPWVNLNSVCLLPYLASKVILDDDSYLIRSASLGDREILISHYKTLNRQLSRELTRPRMDWESTAGLIRSSCESFLELTHKWAGLFKKSENLGLQQIKAWQEKLENILSKKEKEVETSDMAELGCIMIEASCFIMAATTYLPVVDPSVENEVLAKYLADETEYFSSWATAQRLFSLYTTGHDICPTNGNKTDLGHVHPYVHEVFRLLQTSAGKLKEAERNIAARPDPPQYEALRHEAMQFVRTVASKSKIDELTSRVRNLFSELGRKYDSKMGTTPAINESEINAVLILCSSRLESCTSFVHKQMKRFWYWDISLSYLHPATQAITGFSLVCDAVQKISSKARDQEKMKILGMLKFPNDHIPKVSDASRIYEEPWAYKRATKKLLLTSLWTFSNKIISYDCITRNQIRDLHDFANEVARLWKEQQEEKEREKEMENALYVYKGKEKNITGSEEEEDLENIEKIFPDFSDGFQDLVESNEFGAQQPSTVSCSSNISNDVDILENDDVDAFLKVHSMSFSYVSNHCLKSISSETSFDFMKPYRKMFEIGCYAFQNSHLDFNKDDEDNILISSNLMVKRLDPNIASEPIGKDDDSMYDVYRDPNVSEVVNLTPVLSAMRKRISSLLEEFEEQPALLRIIEVLDRIESFDVKSPLIKFLTGLEMLLATADEWEKVAHRGVSIAAHIMEATQLVISWRKQELSYWKNLLRLHFIREQRQAKQWWFHLFTSALEFSTEQYDKNPEQKKNFLKLLLKLMESSPLGQFTTRLHLLEETHRHFSGLLQTQLFDPDTRNSITEIVKYTWNAVAYYKQFVPAVNSRLNSLSAPIEKRMKDFIKISRWGDANLYALRDSVRKNQKTLSKMVTDYKKVLNTPVSTVLIADASGTESQISEKKKNKIKETRTAAYIMTHAWGEDCIVEKSMDNITSQQWPRRLSKLKKYYLKSRQISQDLVEKDNEYTAQIEDMEEMTVKIIDTVHELQNLQIPEEKGDKRKKTLRHVHNLRRKSLAELFKALQNLGLSFRRGLIHLKGLSNENDFCDFSCEPTDLTVGWGNLSCRFPADSELMEAWNGCENYFQKCISRISVMLQAFHSPSKELGPNIIDRCKGYAIDLLQHIMQEKNAIGKCSKLLWELRKLLNIPKRQLEGNDKVEEMCSSHFVDMIYTKAGEIEIEYRQYVLVADSLEEEQNSSVKCLLKTATESVISHIEEIKPKLYDFVSTAVVRDLYDGLIPKQVLHDCCLQFEHILKIIGDAQANLPTSSVLWKSLQKSHAKLSVWLESLKSQLEATRRVVNSKETAKEFVVAVEKSLEDVLLSFQRLDTSGSPESGKVDFGKVTELFLIKRINCFDVNSVVENILKIKHILNESRDDEYQQRNDILESITPLILQFCFTLQFYLKLLTQQHRTTTKMLSVLSAVFSTLGQKGFCLPSDYENDAVEEGPEIDEKSGMGLGEGETTSDAKDVSDRIESEDQLDDTMKAGETAEAADKDVGEDDKGVEMSEDFEGKQQDKQENKENEDKQDDSGDEQNDEDLNQEMGDVDPEGEKVDDKLWGGSSDEEDEEENQKEETGKGAPEKSKPELDSKDQDKTNEENEGANDDQSEPQNQEFNDHSNEDDPNDNQVDPYHGQSQFEEELEAMDLPDDMQLEDQDKNDDKETQEENPFDLDAADRELPEGFDEEEAKEDEENGEEGEKPDEITDDEEEGKNPMDEINVEASQLDQDTTTDPTPEDQDDVSMEVDPSKEDEEKAEEEVDKTVDTNTEQSKESEEKPEPSTAAPSKADDGAASMDQDSSKDKESYPNPTQEEENTDKTDEQASGLVESKDGHGHEGSSVNQENKQSSENNQKTEDASRKPGETDSKRSLADSSDRTDDQLRRLKTVDKSEDNSAEPMEENSGENDDLGQTNSDLYQHIQSAEKKDALTVDNATKDQMDKQKGMQLENEKESEENPKLDETHEEMDIDDDLDELTESEIDKNTPDLIRGLPENKKKQKNKPKNFEDKINQDDIDVEGDVVMTHGAQRPADSYSHTNLELLREKTDASLMETSHEIIDLEVDSASGGYGTGALVEWHDLESKTLSLSQELCEQLRLILEPTQAARLKGDYKTGKRLNMRKVIPYIASGFRKDKIWLRRTQPSKREYQILLALDDSSSMLDNKSKQIAFSAVAVVARALSLLEAGKLAVASFGEDFKLVHSFEDPFTDVSGARIMQNFTFAQKRTRIPQLMNNATALFAQSKLSISSSIHPDTAQLMIIVSDGRGINSDGVEATKRSIMKAREQNVFIVFIIIDNPDNKNSILDIREPIFGPDNSVEIVKYMDNFPFPFYLILREITALPAVLSDALRQWFELVTSSDR